MKTLSLLRRFNINALGAILFCAWISPAQSATIPPIEAASRALAWMNNHPLMGKISREIIRTETFPATDAPGAVYVMSLNPTGYLILNCDDRLPLILAFSENSPISLAESPDNALLALLRKHVATSAEILATSTETAPVMKSMTITVQSQDELIGPLLETSWNQSNPYNLNCPADPTPSTGYDERTPTGCVPTAFAQVLKFHRWPIHGTGTHQYTDVGSIAGTHIADFSDPYDWDSMQNSYNTWDVTSPPNAAKTSVGELMYELGVAAEADYESDGTGSSTHVLGSRLSTHLYYGQTADHDSQSAALTAIAADLRTGLPSVVSVPGHAMVADGLMVTGGTTSYHLNYGWGGSNNGWYSANSVYIGPLDGAVTSIIPQLFPFPALPTVSTSVGQATTLQWLLPRKREHLAQQVQLYQRTNLTQTWSHDASSFGKAANSNWSIDPESQRTDGNCWTAGPSGPATLDLNETFVPSASSQLSFWRWAIVYDNAFRILVSTNNGSSFTAISTIIRTDDPGWLPQTISLAAYAGQNIKLRFELASGAYYPAGGVWIDDLTVTHSTWNSWTPLGNPISLAAHRFSKTTTLWDGAADFTKFPKTSANSSWEVSNLDLNDQGFYRPSGSASGTRDHLTSLSTVSPTANTRLVLRMKNTLASDSFHVLVSTNRTTFTEVGIVTGSNDWSNQTFSLASWADTPIYVRLEYWGGGSYYPGGGVWIDSVSTETLTNPLNEQQPLHYCAFTPTVSGTYEMAATVIDINQVEQPLSPSFTMIVAGPKLAAYGTPHAWLTTYGGVPLESADSIFDAAELSDPLGKGTTLMQEYLFGTDPTNASSRLQLTISRATGGGFTLRWNGMAGRTYRVLSAVALDAPWTESVALPCQTDQTPMSWTDSNPAQDSRFYRLGVGLTE